MRKILSKKRIEKWNKKLMLSSTTPDFQSVIDKYNKLIKEFNKKAKKISKISPALRGNQ